MIATPFEPAFKPRPPEICSIEALLELASELDNVSKASKIMGYSRHQFYEIRRNYQAFGAEGLVDRLPGPRDPHPNRVDEGTESAMLEYNLENPTQGPVRVAQQLVLLGVQVSSGGVGAAQPMFWEFHF